MNFDIGKTNVYKSVKISRFFIFRFADLFKNIFLALFILSLFPLFLSFFESLNKAFAIRLPVLFIILYFLFFEISLFVEAKIKRPGLKPDLQDIAGRIDKDAEYYNLAEFLSFNACIAAEKAIKLCQKKKIEVNSTALFYFLVKTNKDVSVLCYRLGLDAEKLQSDLKNYLEKIKKHSDSNNSFSDNFKKTIIEAAKIAIERGHKTIGEKEILASLADNDEFFKKIMVEFDLKSEDVKNITLWLDSVEETAKQNEEFWSETNLSRAGSMGRDWATGYTVTLDQYSTDWRKIVSKWRFKEITSHKKQVEEAEMILARSVNSNVLIIGNSGAGRKSVVEAIAHRCYLGKSLPELNGERVVELDMVKISATIQNFETLEKTLDQICSEILMSGNVILVINNLDNFVGQSVQKAGAVDVTGVLSKYLAMPEFHFIGITTYDGLHRNIEQNSAFASLFRKIEIPEITEDETIDILQANAMEIEYKKKLIILYPTIREAVHLTARYMPSLPFPEKAIDVLTEAVVHAQMRHEKIVLPHHIAEVVSSKTEIPVGKMEVKEKETLLNLENLIHQRIVNQSEAVKEISIAMRRARAGLSSKKRPMGSFLFLGPTGVGKTETAKALAQIYFNGEEKMIRIDMSEFQAISDIPRLIGAVSPVEMQGLLTTPVRDNPFSLILLDEIEKAHPNILNLFLQVFDEGHITDGQGRKIIFTNTIIICTSNAGAENIFKAVESGEKLDKQNIIGKLLEKGTFKPEFINRFDATVLFSPLTRENLLDIAQLTLGGLKKNLKEKEIDFEITDALKQKVVELSYKPEFGAREMRRVIQDKIENVVAEALLSEKIRKGDRMEIDAEKFEVVVYPKV